VECRGGGLAERKRSEINRVCKASSRILVVSSIRVVVISARGVRAHGAPRRAEARDGRRGGPSPAGVDRLGGAQRRHLQVLSGTRGLALHAAAAGVGEAVVVPAVPALPISPPRRSASSAASRCSRPAAPPRCLPFDRHSDDHGDEVSREGGRHHHGAEGAGAEAHPTKEKCQHISLSLSLARARTALVGD